MAVFELPLEMVEQRQDNRKWRLFNILLGIIINIYVATFLLSTKLNLLFVILLLGLIVFEDLILIRTLVITKLVNRALDRLLSHQNVILKKDDDSKKWLGLHQDEIKKSIVDLKAKRSFLLFGVIETTDRYQMIFLELRESHHIVVVEIGKSDLEQCENQKLITGVLSRIRLSEKLTQLPGMKNLYRQTMFYVKR